MEDFLLIVIVMLAAGGAASAVSYDAAVKQTVKNCELFGQFQHEDKVFTCALKERK